MSLHNQRQQVFLLQQQQMQEMQQDNQRIVVEVRDRPRRPLSAYNLFFQQKRKELLKDRPVRPEGVPARRGHGKMGFAEMAKTVAAMWRDVDSVTKAEFEALAKTEKLRYKKDMAEWKKLCAQSKKAAKTAASSTSSSQGSSMGLLPEAQPCPSQTDAVFVSANSRDGDLNVSGDNYGSNPPQVPSAVYVPRETLSQSQEEKFAASLLARASQQHQEQQRNAPATEPSSIHYFQPSTQVFQDGIRILSEQLDGDSLDLFVNLFQP